MPNGGKPLNIHGTARYRGKSVGGMSPESGVVPREGVPLSSWKTKGVFVLREVL
jgi:hypothetical protein